MPIPNAAGRYPNAVRDVLDREALRCIRQGGSEVEQLARMQSVVRSKINVLSTEYRPVFDRAVKSMCTTSFNKVCKELRIAALAGPAGPTQVGTTIMGPNCGTGASGPGDAAVPGPHSAGCDDERVVAKVLIGEGGELTEKSAQQLVLEDLDRIMEVLPPLAERDFMEADRLESAAKESAQGAKEHRARGNRILALFKRYDRLVVGIDSIPGIFNLADYLAEVGAQALGLDDEDAELLRYAGAL
ncbi:hypothetical protein E4N62_13270 [Streptomyces sp. MNU76]|uniref:hypothetical protein n=1 Tax=Streptomyces sp. MNU76 TaxID=2560026 RepID=UPI001E4CE09F|nr:hypothetical protein [Streptomyces sp. MNU76]MCC9706152.1 hypothetical protein [Streptomyces sp. MNU76]